MDMDERNVFIGIMVGLLILLHVELASSQETVPITFNVRADKISLIKNTMWYLYPVPTETTIDSLGNITVDTLFTKNQWAKECIRRWIVKQIKRYEYKLARDSITVEDHDGDIE